MAACAGHCSIPALEVLNWSAGLKKQLVIRSTIVNRKRAGMKIESAPRMKLPAKESLLRVKSFAKRKDKLAGYAGCNENFVLLTTGITGVLSFEL